MSRSERLSDRRDLPSGGNWRIAIGLPYGESLDTTQPYIARAWSGLIAGATSVWVQYSVDGFSASQPYFIFGAPQPCLINFSFDDPSLRD